LDQVVVVEEKLDGANVMVWFDNGAPQVGTRGGADTLDRSGERGRLRAWAAANSERLRRALEEHFALYGEWLRVPHAIRYAELPGPLVGIDVLDRRNGQFLTPDKRDAILAAADIPKPPVRFRGRLKSVEEATEMLGASLFAAPAAEGLIIRAAVPVLNGPRIAKLVDPAFVAGSPVKA